MPDMATDDQRWDIYQLFERFNITEPLEIRATAAKILRIDYLSDLRNLTQDEAAELIEELRRAIAAKRVASD